MSTPNRYSRGKIYKICRDDCSDIYIGSTTVPTLAKRLGEHVSSTKAGANKCTSVQLLSHPGYYIILLEEYPCNSRDALRAREQYWIDASEHAINKRRACAGVSGSTKQEYNHAYQQKYREEHQQRSTRYYVENKETINQRRAEKITCECGAIYSQQHKTRHQRSQKHLQLMAARPTEL